MESEGTRTKRFFLFGNFRLDTLKRLLLCNEQVQPLPSHAFDALLTLVQSAGEVLTKDELMRRLWPDTIVGENNLTIIISGLRKTLGEAYDEHAYIVTVPGTGYRFVATVEELSLEEFQARSRTAPAANLPAHRGQEVKSSADSPIRSLAVLPFKPLGQACEPYLGLGLADALITRLGNCRQIIVRPTSAIVKYASLHRDPLAAGRILGVDSVLDAHFQLLEEEIRVTVQLMRVADGVQLWSETISDKFQNLFSMQDTISKQVADALLLRLNDDERRRLTKHYTKDSEAYRAYLYGRYFWNKRTADGLKRAIAYFKQACANDPSYALAYAGLADCYSLFDYYSIQAPKECLPNAKAAALEALRLDESLAEPHASLGLVSAVYEWNWTAAEREYRRAIEINPNYATAHQWYAEYLVAAGRRLDARAEIDHALSVDPLSLGANTAMGLILYFERLYKESIAQLERTLELDSEFGQAWLLLARALAASGSYKDAIAQAHKALKFSGDDIRLLAELGYLYAVTRNQSQLERVLERIQEQSKRMYVPAFSLAVIAAARGRIEESFHALHQAVEERTWDVLYLRYDPKLDVLRADSRFAALLRQIGLPGR